MHWLTHCCPFPTGDGMNAYMAYKVSTQVYAFYDLKHSYSEQLDFNSACPSFLFYTYAQTTLPMFRGKQFTVRRRFSDFLGLYEKLSEKHSQNGYIVPPPPEKSILGILDFVVQKLWINIAVYHYSFSKIQLPHALFLKRNDQSEGGKGRPIVSWVCWTEESCSRKVILYNFLYRWIVTVLRTISCLSNGKMVPSIKLLLRYLQRLVSHPSLLQDPDVREFLEKEEVRERSLVTHTL